MKFVADVMLGSLAKRLRLMGYDVIYSPSFSDNEIIRMSLEQNRLILTRDTGLARRPLAGNHLLIESNHPEEQVWQVLQSFSLRERPAALTRCSVCNEPLTVLDKNEAKDRVPPHVYERTKSFMQCGVCGRVYWQGTHVRKMGLAG